MDQAGEWIDVGAAEDFKREPLREAKLGERLVAVSFKDGKFGVISNVCNHVGGPLGKGRLDGEFVVCPWHQYKFHRCTGEGEPGYEADKVPGYGVKEENGRLLVTAKPTSKRGHLPHEPHPLTRSTERAPGTLRVGGISTTAMDAKNPRFSTSEHLLGVALEHAASTLGAETKLIKLNDLSFRNCEGYYSKAAKACTWPCSVTSMDKTDQLDRVYEMAVHWADILLIATPIRWGAASSLYYKMVERMNCIQNQITLNNKVLIRNKVAAFIITGGQDGIQAVAGQMMGFFSEIGYLLPQFPFIAHSLGWEFEEMERNMDFVQSSESLRAGARDLVARASEMSRCLLEREMTHASIERGGRKASQN
ncbi:MAG TPA: Rieske 2Fe-2S domain-containing protein [Steroidobacteraceae bacterium]|nr:Rieske 2Fe-2S domain-containing protein [Steroidobacteraceae bacterium]